MTVHSILRKEGEWAWKHEAKAHFARARKDVLLETRAVHSQEATFCARRFLGRISLHASNRLPMPRHYELARGCAWKSSLGRHAHRRARSEAHTEAHGHVTTSGHEQGDNAITFNARSAVADKLDGKQYVKVGAPILSHVERRNLKNAYISQKEGFREG